MPFFQNEPAHKGSYMLNGDEIRKRKIIRNPVDGSFRAASYDLTVGVIISPDQNEPVTNGSFVVPPQGMVEVVSAEQVALPRQIAANTTLKNSLSSQGILSLNVGIIDPLYEGLISSTLVNFNKTAVSIRIADPFMRVTFSEYEPQANLRTPPLLKAEEYIQQRIRKVRTQFPHTFLDLESNVPRLSGQVVEGLRKEWRDTLFVYVPIAALILALMFGFLPFVIDAIAYRRADYNSRLEQETKMQESLSSLRQQVETLKAQLEARTNSTATSPPQSTAKSHK